MKTKTSSIVINITFKFVLQLGDNVKPNYDSVNLEDIEDLDVDSMVRQS